MRSNPFPIRLAALMTAVLLSLVGCDDDRASPTPAPAPTAVPPTPTPSPAAGQEPGFALSFVVPPGTDASPPEDSPKHTAGAWGFSHYVFEMVGDRVVTTLVEGPRYEQVRLPVSYSQLKELRESGRPADQLRMTPEELATLVDQLDTVRASTEPYRDVEVALEDGFVQVTDEVPNMGAHFVHPWRTIDGIFDPSQPEILLYIRGEKEEWELVGTSFVQPMQLVGTDHPDAFAGPLDNWHVHFELCTGPSVTSRSITPEECKAQGGIWVPTYGWMIHAWVWLDNPLGAFNMWNPNVPPIAQGQDIRQSRSVGGDLAILIENFSFETARIGVGDTLAWTNVDGVPHTVTAQSVGPDRERFDSGLVAPGQSFNMRFDQSGEYQYACALHPFMTGRVFVAE